MKKIVLAVLVGVMLSVTACGATKEEASDTSKKQTTSAESTDASESVGDEKSKTDDAITEELPAEYYVTMDGKKVKLFTVYKLDKVYTEKELNDVNPMMLYLGDSDECSYGFMYCPEHPEDLTKDEKEVLDNFASEMEDIKSCFSVIES